MSDDIYVTLAHEGFPGHLYQTVYARGKKLPLVRELFHFPGYIEGWAEYVEFYSYGLGLEGDLAVMERLYNSLNIALHAYIDLSVHYSGWDAEKVQDFLTNYGIASSEVARMMLERMVEDPANYLSYYVGNLEFSRLRDQAEKLWGDAYSLKEYHRFVLDLGPAPFYLIEKRMKERAMK